MSWHVYLPLSPIYPNYVLEIKQSTFFFSHLFQSCTWRELLCPSLGFSLNFPKSFRLCHVTWFLDTSPHHCLDLIFSEFDLTGRKYIKVMIYRDSNIVYLWIGPKYNDLYRSCGKITGSFIFTWNAIKLFLSSLPLYYFLLKNKFYLIFSLSNFILYANKNALFERYLAMCLKLLHESI